MAAIRTVPCSSVTSRARGRTRGAGRAGLGDALVDVGHLEGDVDDAVAVLGVVLRSAGCRATTAPLTTNWIEPDLSTNDLWSRLPFSGPE